jgi:hypothetical protein
MKARSIPANSTHGKVEGPPNEHLVVFENGLERQLVLCHHVFRYISLLFVDVIVGGIFDMLDGLKLGHVACQSLHVDGTNRGRL